MTDADDTGWYEGNPLLKTRCRDITDDIDLFLDAMYESFDDSKPLMIYTQGWELCVDGRECHKEGHRANVKFKYGCYGAEEHTFDIPDVLYDFRFEVMRDEKGDMGLRVRFGPYVSLDSFGLPVSVMQSVMGADGKTVESRLVLTYYPKDSRVE